MVLLIDQNPQIDLNRALSCARPLHPQGVFKVRVGVNNNLLAPVMGGVGGSCSVRGPRGWPDPIPHMVSLPYYTIWPLHMSSSPSAHPHPDQANILQSLPGFPFEANLLQFKAQGCSFCQIPIVLSRLPIPNQAFMFMCTPRLPLWSKTVVDTVLNPKWLSRESIAIFFILS